MVLILKFFGLGLNDKNQANVKLYCHGKLVFNDLTYNGKIVLNSMDDKEYFMVATFHNEKILAPIYFKKDTYCFFFNHSYISSRIITFTLFDYFYNLPIKEGELILWQR